MAEWGRISLRISLCWRFPPSSSALGFSGSSWGFSLGFISSHSLTPHTHGFSREIVPGSVFMKAASSSGRFFRSRHRTSVFSVHPTDPPPLSVHLLRVGRAVLSRTEQPRLQSPQDPGATWGEDLDSNPIKPSCCSRRESKSLGNDDGRQSAPEGVTAR